MINELETLVALQRSDLEIAALESRLKKIPREVAALEQEVATERAGVKAAEDQLKESQKSRRTLEGELQIIEDRIEKYKDQLMQVKSNEEYRAMQKQIQAATEDVSTHEDMILAKMEESDQFQEELTARRKELEEGLAHVSKLEAELDSEAKKLHAELERRNGERVELKEALPEDLYVQYQQIKHLRGGVAVAEAKDEHCQECNVRLRPQVFSELRMGSKILRCDNCSRILYYQSSDISHPTSDENGKGQA
jgi:predicted  nucleic acid-binding Zn-ribbon protein